MRIKIFFSRKSLKKAVSCLIAFSLLCSFFIFASPDPYDEMIASAVNMPSGLTVLEKISDIDTSNFTFTNVPNIATATNTMFVNTPANDGRVWTDKSVNATQAFIYDTAGGVADTVRAPDNEFLVTLSALSQTINTEEIIVEPSDTVIIIDISGSMVSNTVPGDGRSRIAVVIDALNDAIVMLMKASPDNRVSVVVYGGQFVGGQNQAKTYPVLTLGRYEISQPIFSVAGSTVTVNSAITNPLQRSFDVEGGTPTQLGMRRGADMLLAVPRGLGPSNNGTDFDTGLPDPTGSGNIIVTRKPNIILMTDGEPTFAWHDYKMNNFVNWQGVTTTANWYDVGNGSAGDMGLTALTVMTASFLKQQVRDHYYGTIASNPQNASQSVGFYTLGLGVNSTIANAMLDPYGKSVSGQTNASLVIQALNGINYNMLDVLNNFTSPSASSQAFPYLNRGSGTARSLVTVLNDSRFVTTCSYDTMSFTAMDKQGLDDAFSQITQQIVSQGNYTTNISNDPQFDGYLAFSDVIGEYMEFTGFNGIWYNNINYNASTFGNVINDSAPGSPVWNETIANLIRHLDIADTSPLAPITDITARDIIQSSIDGGALNRSANSRMVYYADFNRDFVSNYYELGGGGATVFPNEAAAIAAGARAKVELYTVYAPAVDALKGDPTNLMLMVFQVVTVLQAGSFNQLYSAPPGYLVCNLQPGDQIVRWYIPASLIPLRGVKQVFNTDGTPQKDDFGFDVIQVSEAVPLRAMFSVAPNVSKIERGLTAQYSNVNKAPGNNSYYFYTDRWRGMDGSLISAAPRYDMNNLSMATFIPNLHYNTFYQRVWTRDTVLKTPVVTGPTGTSPWCWRYAEFTAGNTVQVQDLGNNGRIMIRSEAQLTINKTFTEGVIIPPPPEFMFTLLILGTDAAGNDIFRGTLNYPDDFINNSAVINVPPGNYVIHEKGGYIANYIFTNPTPIVVVPPVTAGSRTINIHNAYTPYTPTFPTLLIRKMFSGLLPPGDPNTEIPQDFIINVEHLESGRLWTFDISQISSANITTPDLIAGTYRISESNYSVNGFTWESRPTLPFDFTIDDSDIDLANPKQILIMINNRYTPIPVPTYTLDLRKNVLGLTGSTDAAGNQSVPQGLVFKLEKISIPTFLQTIRYEDLSSINPITGLPGGDYRLTELGGSADGFSDPNVSLTMNGVTVQNGLTFSLPGTNVNSDNTVFFNFTNRYDPTDPPPPPESLVVRKLLSFPSGTTNAQIQQHLQRLRNQGFAIVVTGPGGFNQRINIDTAIRGAVFENITAGNYTFSESNAALPGLTFTSNPILPFTRFIQPDTTDAVTIEIQNIYTPSPPAPQTGVTRNIILPIIILLLGAAFITSAEIYRRRVKRKSK